jgi:hypothetical protein
VAVAGGACWVSNVDRSLSSERAIDLNWQPVAPPGERTQYWEFRSLSVCASLVCLHATALIIARSRRARNPPIKIQLGSIVPNYHQRRDCVCSCRAEEHDDDLQLFFCVFRLVLSLCALINAHSA